MNNSIMNMLMNQLHGKNPQGFQFLEQAMKTGGNPNALVQQVVGNLTPEQRQNIITQAKDFGCPESILKQIQDMK